VDRQGHRAEFGREAVEQLEQARERHRHALPFRAVLVSPAERKQHLRLERAVAGLPDLGGQGPQALRLGPAFW